MTQEQEQVQLDDGYWIDPVTGEVIDLQDESVRTDMSVPFIPTDEGGVNWVLRKMQAEEAAIKAVANTPEVLQARAILDNAAKMVGRHSRKLDYLHRRFDGDLIEFAKQQLGGKGKTWHSIFGSIGTRKVPGGVRVLDNEKAAEAAENLGFDYAVKRSKTFGISLLRPQDLDMIQAYLSDDGESAASQKLREGFFFQPDTERPVIATGVEK